MEREEDIRLFSLQGSKSCFDLIILVMFIFDIVIDAGDFLIKLTSVYQQQIPKASGWSTYLL